MKEACYQSGMVTPAWAEGVSWGDVWNSHDGIKVNEWDNTRKWQGSKHIWNRKGYAAARKVHIFRSKDRWWNRWRRRWFKQLLSAVHQRWCNLLHRGWAAWGPESANICKLKGVPDKLQDSSSDVTDLRWRRHVSEASVATVWAFMLWMGAASVSTPLCCDSKGLKKVQKQQKCHCEIKHQPCEETWAQTDGSTQRITQSFTAEMSLKVKKKEAAAFKRLNFVHSSVFD